MESFKTAVEKECVFLQERVETTSFTYEEVIKNVSMAECNASNETLENVICLIMDKLCPLVSDIKEYANEFGFMNTFSHEDVYNILKKTVEYDVVADDDTNEEEDEDDEEVISF